jgi:hypothetical protein
MPVVECQPMRRTGASGDERTTPRTLKGVERLRIACVQQTSAGIPFYDFMTSKSFNTSTITSEESLDGISSTESATSNQRLPGNPPPRIPARSRRFYAADDGFQEAIKISFVHNSIPSKTNPIVRFVSQNTSRDIFFFPTAGDG